ncbi:hypothetical protein [Halococcus agarilyticus]|uniref:hypothetical protein n=1 Tax=Halococcus agarilyticus TaxID=1232219 RepID=UPI000677E66A|nr:hypothetical protein [Halococcus agarilyticus]
MLSRRGVLRALALGGIGGVAGCSAITGDDGYDPGTLVVENSHSLAHVIEVRVVDGPTTSPAVESELSGTFAVDADETKSYPEFVTTDGRFEIEATLGSDDETIEFAFNPIDGIGDTSSGTYATVSVDGSGQLSWTLSPVE